jgi:hypothetical protein
VQAKQGLRDMLGTADKGACPFIDDFEQILAQNIQKNYLLHVGNWNAFAIRLDPNQCTAG